MMEEIDPKVGMEFAAMLRACPDCATDWLDGAFRAIHDAGQDVEKLKHAFESWTVTRREIIAGARHICVRRLVS